MTVGERIQTHRKQLEMSQEELGQKLLVSRQTISLWEKDQTVPTIDNLIKLSEIFGVSVDAMLGIGCIEQNDELLPKETYQVCFTKDELDKVYGLQRRAIYKRPFIFTLICVFLLLLLIGASAPDSMIGVIVGVGVIGVISHIKGIRAYSKAWKHNAEQISRSTYEYKVFDDYISCSIYRENIKTHESRCAFADIEQIQQLDKWLFLQYSGQTFLIRKSDLKENSALYSYMYINPSRIMEKPALNRWKMLSVMLVVASVLSLFGAMCLVAFVSSINMMATENMWLFFLFTPIPIASVVLGLKLKAKNYKYKKNIVVGIIVTLLLCGYGSFSFLFAGLYDHSDKPIARAEQMVGIDIPVHKQISTQDWTKGTQSVSGGYIYSTSNIYFDNSAVEEFEAQLSNDDRWLSFVPNNMIGIASPLRDYNMYDYVLIYNVDTAEYNLLPDNSGKCRFINILYRLEDNQMQIVEYDIDYVK